MGNGYTVMSMYLGKSGSVTLNGSTVASITAWSVNTNPVILEHYGAGMSAPSLKFDYAKKSGSFDFEVNSSDSNHAGLLSDGVTTYTLALLGSSGFSFSAYCWGGQSMSRAGKITGRASFREV
jgi:hypothetical protein